jgi:hypothetical protein
MSTPALCNDREHGREIDRKVAAIHRAELWNSFEEMEFHLYFEEKTGTFGARDVREDEDGKANTHASLNLVHAHQRGSRLRGSTFLSAMPTRKLSPCPTTISPLSAAVSPD